MSVPTPRHFIYNLKDIAQSLCVPHPQTMPRSLTPDRCLHVNNHTRKVPDRHPNTLEKQKQLNPTPPLPQVVPVCCRLTGGLLCRFDAVIGECVTGLVGLASESCRSIPMSVLIICIGTPDPPSSRILCLSI